MLTKFNKRRIILALFVGSLFGLSSAHGTLTAGYNNLNACDKQKELWDKIKDSDYIKHGIEVPDFDHLNFGKLMKLGFQIANNKTKKVSHFSDIAPKGWKKYLHKRGAVAMVKIVTNPEARATGILAGAPCGLLRLSLTYKPNRHTKGIKKRDVAPGLALKVLRDKGPSANISALYKLEGQKKDYNFFAHPLSNIVPVFSKDFGARAIHDFFKRATDYPEELRMDDFASIDSKGKKSGYPKVPKQVFFNPNPYLSKASTPHDVRDDFLSIPEGTMIYEIWAVADEKSSRWYQLSYKNDHIDGKLGKSMKVAEIVTTSKFKVSEFGDTGLFFRHEVQPSTYKADDYNQ